MGHRTNLAAGGLTVGALGARYVVHGGCCKDRLASSWGILHCSRRNGVRGDRNGCARGILQFRRAGIEVRGMATLREAAT
jgi:hypothetical protein